MKKRFMGVFAAIVSSFAADNSIANTMFTQESKPAQETPAALTTATSQLISVTTNSGDAFDFVLQRSAETGLLMTYHSSHSSHRSHSSHYSSRP
jgi:hypothetical protein